MSDIKWIKISTDIFNDEKMIMIETLPDGLQIEVVWFKILCLAGKSNQNGFLMINNKFPYTDEMLSKIFRMDVAMIKRAIDVFVSLEMIEVVDNAYMVSNWMKHQNIKGLEELNQKNRERQQRYRDKQKQAKLTDSEKRNVTRNVTDNVTVASDSNVNCSYSYSISNSYNLNLLNNILINSNYKNREYISNNKDILELFESWFRYKDQKKDKYTEQGMKSWLSTHVEYINKLGFDVVYARFQQAMANDWKGTNMDSVKTDNKPAERKPNITDDLDFI